MRPRTLVALLVGLPLVCLLAGTFFYFLPPVHARLAWRVDNLRAQVKRALNPPEQVVFVPQEQVDAIVAATLQALNTAQAATATLTAGQNGPTETPLPSPTATLSPTPIPAQAALTGIVHEYQKFNNCGPANLSMTLSYWGWQGDQRDTAAFLRPGKYDKNVMPAEMIAFVESQTDLEAVARVGGNPALLKRFIAAGFPVIIEEGHDPENDDWMGHYLTLNAYDDEKGLFIAQDSLIMPDFPRPYADLALRWRDFNYVYIVIYPPDREAEVLAILGPQSVETDNYRYAAELALQETVTLSGRDLYFAWFNQASNLVALEDYAGAAAAYDTAFAMYPTIPEEDRPWRMMWYQEGPYAAYYYTGRYQDVIDLADTTFFALGEYTLEESFYWRGLAKEALGDHNGAIFDLQKTVELNPNFTPGREQLSRLGIAAPQTP
jgi:hypothetical protein